MGIYFEILNFMAREKKRNPYKSIRILGICFGIPGSTLELLEIPWSSFGALEFFQDNLSFINFLGFPMNVFQFPNNLRNSLGFFQIPCNPSESLTITEILSGVSVGLCVCGCRVRSTRGAAAV